MTIGVPIVLLGMYGMRTQNPDYGLFVMLGIFLQGGVGMLLGGIAGGVLLSARSKQHKGGEAHQDKPAA